jgi:hypothetical protein
MQNARPHCDIRFDYTHEGAISLQPSETLKGQSCLARLNPRTWSRQARRALITAISLAALILLFLAPRMPTGPGYHDFADKRTLFGIPNGLDVLSNVPFCLVGIWGLLWLGGKKGLSAFLDRRERMPYLVFFAGVALTGIGSFWYHIDPSDDRLPWDLLPMTCSFTSIVVVTYMERLNLRMGFIALLPALLLGVFSVVYWVVTNSSGKGDYKFYLFVQFFSPVLLALIIGLFQPRYSGIGYLAGAFGLYVVAKLFEEYDYSIFRHLDRLVSGHSLKHVTAAFACYAILRMLQTRHPLRTESIHNDKGIDLITAETTGRLR